MHTWKEIQAMSNDQIAAANKVLMKKLVLTRIVFPIAATAVACVAANYIANKLEATPEA